MGNWRQANNWLVSCGLFYIIRDGQIKDGQSIFRNWEQLLLWTKCQKPKIILVAHVLMLDFKSALPDGSFILLCGQKHVISACFLQKTFLEPKMLNWKFKLMQLKVLEYLWKAQTFIIISCVNAEFVVSNYKMPSNTTIWIILSGSKILSLSYLPSKASFQELQFNTEWFCGYLIPISCLKK